MPVSKPGLQTFDLATLMLICTSGKPFESYKHTIKTLIDANRRITRMIADRLSLSNPTVHDHLKGLFLLSYESKTLT